MTRVLSLSVVHCVDARCRCGVQVGIIRAVQRSLALVAVAVCLALVVAGCGSSSSSTSLSSLVARSAIAKKMAEARAKAAEAGADKIKNYGAEAGGAEKAAVVSAMRGFLLALDDSDFEKVCAGLLSKTRAALERLGRMAHKGKDCAAILAAIRSNSATIQSEDVAKATNGRVTDVRVGKGTAYVLYRPPGGGPLSYYTMEDENGEWKATGLGIGTPLYPPLPD
jgi:hypothetical protein